MKKICNQNGGAAAGRDEVAEVDVVDTLSKRIGRKAAERLTGAAQDIDANPCQRPPHPLSSNA